MTRPQDLNTFGTGLSDQPFYQIDPKAILQRWIHENEDESSKEIMGCASSISGDPSLVRNSTKNLSVEESAKKYYRPSWDALPTNTLSPKHIKYIPLRLVGEERCASTNLNGECVRHDLEHVLLFHSNRSTLQKRWSLLAESGISTYFGFHITSHSATLDIAHGDFRISQRCPLMLGFGVYFARALLVEGFSEGGPKSEICAEIRMGRVLEVTKDRISSVMNSKDWWNNYDTVYFQHEIGERDEFCVKDPAQILRWIIAA